MTEFYEVSQVLNFPFSPQLGTIVSGFAGTIEAISQVHFGGKKGVTER
jgi:hypothetical protein